MKRVVGRWITSHCPFFRVYLQNSFWRELTMAVNASAVKELREKTGAGMLDCKKALEEANGDLTKAAELLREKGLAAAANKAGRAATEGTVESYIHAGGRIGVLVEVNCETDFVGKTDQFKEFVKDIAMQIAAASPKFVSREEVSTEELEKEKEILRAQALNEGKPEKIVEKMVEGRIGKYYEEFCLLEQPFVKDPDKTISQLLNEKISQIGENISIRRFVRYELGEGLEKKVDNFVEEVMSQVNK
nr:translation elongation factor Ts [Paenibacillus sp. JJ-223]